jgi:hypothetical protein
MQGMLKENNMFKKIPITDFEKSQIRGFKKWLTDLIYLKDWK